MRQWHRWLSFVFGAFLLFIAITGVASHVAAMVARGAVFEQEERKAPATTVQVTKEATARQSATAQAPAPKPKRKLVGLLHHLHSGEWFGPVGVVISLLSGFAMIFFSFSGLWLYFQMYVRRRKLGKPEAFWK